MHGPVRSLQNPHIFVISFHKNWLSYNSMCAQVSQQFPCLLPGECGLQYSGRTEIFQGSTIMWTCTFSSAGAFSAKILLKQIILTVCRLHFKENHHSASKSKSLYFLQNTLFLTTEVTYCRFSMSNVRSRHKSYGASNFPTCLLQALLFYTVSLKPDEFLFSAVFAVSKSLMWSFFGSD